MKIYDYPSTFCAVWPEIVEIVEYWKSLSKSKQPGNCLEKHKTSTLVSNYKDPVVFLC